MIAFVGATIKVAMMVRQRRVAYHHRLYGDCYGVDSRDDYGDVVAHRVPVVHVVSCTSDSESTCLHPTTVVMTSVSCDLNCEMKDLLKLDIFFFQSDHKNLENHHH